MRYLFNRADSLLGQWVCQCECYSSRLNGFFTEPLHRTITCFSFFINIILVQLWTLGLVLIIRTQCVVKPKTEYASLLQSRKICFVQISIDHTHNITRHHNILFIVRQINIVQRTTFRTLNVSVFQCILIHTRLSISNVKRVSNKGSVFLLVVGLCTLVPQQ